MKEKDKWIKNFRSRMEGYSEPAPADLWVCIFYGTLLSGSLLCLITERKLNFNYFNRLKPT